MPKFNEESFNNWRKPPSDTEETKLSNAERTVKDAISKNSELNGRSIDIYGQGSYANDTNVRLNSDVDINLCLSNTIFVDIPAGKRLEDYGYTNSDYTFSQYKQTVYQALIHHFGINEVERSDKCLRIKGNSYRVAADVVPTFKYLRHEINGSINTGAKLISDSGNSIINFSLQHIENGKV